MVRGRPSFLVLGAGKAGSTSLAYLLDQHPDICMSYPKEPPFFQTEYHQGLDYYWKKYFRSYAGQAHAGEAAHQNSRLPYVARRIHESVPEAKLFLICRNPVERAFSAYWQNFTRKADQRSFDEAIDENLERLRTGPLFEQEAEAELYARAIDQARQSGRVAYASYVDSGHYAEHVERFAALFGRERIKVLFFEDLARAPQEVADAAYAHLGLDPVPLRDTAAQNTPIHPILARLFQTIGGLPLLGRVPPAWRAKLRTALSSRFKGAKPEMSGETRRLLIEHFRPHNRRLAEVTGRNLDHWQ